MSPVTHPLPTLAFGVAKGGRWGTALNTPVFKTIWQKVQKMPEALAHAFTVKLDPDTVFMPERLASLLPPANLKSYLVNCNEGLHGPIEVVSREAIKKLDWDLCGNIPEEDIWLQSCLERVGAQQVTAFPALLWEHGCKPRMEGSCGAYNVAYHPRTPQRYVQENDPGVVELLWSGFAISAVRGLEGLPQQELPSWSGWEESDGNT
eukprot:s848_g20.t1